MVQVPPDTHTHQGWFGPVDCTCCMPDPGPSGGRSDDGTFLAGVATALMTLGTLGLYRAEEIERADTGGREVEQRTTVPVQRDQVALDFPSDP